MGPNLATHLDPGATIAITPPATQQTKHRRSLGRPKTAPSSRVWSIGPNGHSPHPRSPVVSFYHHTCMVSCIKSPTCWSKFRTIGFECQARVMRSTRHFSFGQPNLLSPTASSFYCLPCTFMSWFSSLMSQRQDPIPQA